MSFTLILEYRGGERVDMPTTANQYMTSNVERLSPPPGTISISSYAGMDGSYLDNAFCLPTTLKSTTLRRGLMCSQRAMSKPAR